MIEIVKPQTESTTTTSGLGDPTKNLMVWFDEAGQVPQGSMVTVELRSEDLQTTIQTLTTTIPASGVYATEIIAPDDASTGDRYKIVTLIDGSVDDIQDVIIVDKVTS